LGTFQHIQLESVLNSSFGLKNTIQQYEELGQNKAFLGGLERLK
jgi:hypothetical protein